MGWKTRTEPRCDCMSRNSPVDRCSNRCDCICHHQDRWLELLDARIANKDLSKKVRTLEEQIRLMEKVMLRCNYCRAALPEHLAAANEPGDTTCEDS